MTGRNQDESWVGMKASYSYLATFIPDTDAKLVSRGMEALQSGNLQHKDQSHVNQALEVQEKALKQSQGLLRELDNFLTGWSEKLKKA